MCKTSIVRAEWAEQEGMHGSSGEGGGGNQPQRQPRRLGQCKTSNVMAGWAEREGVNGSSGRGRETSRNALDGDGKGITESLDFRVVLVVAHAQKHVGLQHIDGVHQRHTRRDLHARILAAAHHGCALDDL